MSARSVLYLRGGKGAAVSLLEGEGADSPALRRLRYAPGVIGEERLDALLAAAHGLHPIAVVEFRKERTGFVFARPVPWPFFMRLELAKPFASSAARWAPQIGARSVSGFSLGSESMDVELG